MITKHYECFLASVIRHANRTLSATYYVVFGLFGSTLFFRISHKRHDVWEKKLLYMQQCVSFFPKIMSEKFLILTGMERHINVRGSYVKYP
jgi:hypothetical protein